MSRHRKCKRRYNTIFRNRNKMTTNEGYEQSLFTETPHSEVFCSVLRAKNAIKLFPAYVCASQCNIHFVEDKSNESLRTGKVSVLVSITGEPVTRWPGRFIFKSRSCSACNLRPQCEIVSHLMSFCFRVSPVNVKCTLFS